MTDITARLLAAHEAYFDVERDCEVCGRRFDGHARFREDASRYVLSKRAKLWSVHVDEHILFTCVKRLDAECLDELVAFMTTDALRLVHPDAEHMTTYLSLVVIAESAADEALRAAAKTKFRKNFAFGFRGWCDLRVAAVDVSRRRIVANVRGRDLLPVLEANAFPAQSA